MGYALGVVGAGMMAEAIVRGILRAGLLTPGQIIASDVAAPRRELFASLGIKAVESNDDVAEQADAVLLSVKPYQMQSALAGMGAAMKPDTLVLSIAAAISTKAIESALGVTTAWRVVRAMPNTPMLVGAGAVGVARGAHATDADVARAVALFGAAADVVEVPEAQIDAVTAVSGSGPAYVFFLVEQMIRAGVELGLSPEVARTLAVKTAQGAAKMLAEAPETTPAEQRRRVTTPNGTTHAAITTMEERGWPEATVEALKAAARRSREMAT